MPDLSGKTIFSIVFVQRGFVGCVLQEHALSLPRIIIDDRRIDSLEEAKQVFEQKTSIKIKRNSISLLDSKKDFIHYGVIVDFSLRKAEQRSALMPKERVPFSEVELYSWDDGDWVVINWFLQHPDYVDARRAVQWNLTFYYYSPDNLAMIDDLFTGTSNIWQFDAPDVVFEGERQLVGVEFFDVNASLFTKKGSAVYKARKEWDEEIKRELKSSSELVVSSSRTFRWSLEYLWKAFCSSYEKHSCINRYRENLKNIAGEKRAEVGLCVTDSTLLGSHFRMHGGSLHVFYLFYLEEFWNLFKQSPYPFMLFQQTGQDEKKLFFITKNDYAVLKSEGLIFSLSTIEGFFFPNPHIVAYKTAIPKK